MDERNSFKENGSDNYWDLEKHFIERWRHYYLEDSLESSARIFANMEWLAFRYNIKVMQEVTGVSREEIEAYRKYCADTLNGALVTDSDSYVPMFGYPMDEESIDDENQMSSPDSYLTDVGCPIGVMPIEVLPYTTVVRDETIKNKIHGADTTQMVAPPLTCTLTGVGARSIIPMTVNATSTVRCQPNPATSGPQPGRKRKLATDRNHPKVAPPEAGSSKTLPSLSTPISQNKSTDPIDTTELLVGPKSNQECPDPVQPTTSSLLMGVKKKKNKYQRRRARLLRDPPVATENGSCSSIPVPVSVSPPVPPESPEPSEASGNVPLVSISQEKTPRQLKSAKRPNKAARAAAKLNNQATAIITKPGEASEAIATINTPEKATTPSLLTGISKNKRKKIQRRIGKLLRKAAAAADNSSCSAITVSESASLAVPTGGFGPSEVSGSIPPVSIPTEKNPRQKPDSKINTPDDAALAIVNTSRLEKHAQPVSIPSEKTPRQLRTPKRLKKKAKKAARAAAKINSQASAIITPGVAAQAQAGAKVNTPEKPAQATDIVARLDEAAQDTTAINRPEITAQAQIMWPNETINPTSVKCKKAPTDLVAAISTINYGSLNKAHADFVLDAICAEIVKQAMNMDPDSDVEGPKFNKNQFSDGLLKFYCEDEHTFSWLQKAVATIRLPSGSRLMVTPVSEAFRTRCGLFVPGTWDNTADIGKLLRYQNPWAKIEQWRVYATTQCNKYTLVRLTIPDDLLPLILENGRRLNFGLGSIYIRFLGLRGIYQETPLERPCAEPKTNLMRVTEEAKPALSTSDKGCSKKAPKDLTVGITTINNGHLTQAESDFITEAITEQLITEARNMVPGSEVSGPKFKKKPDLNDGLLELCCEDQDTFSWLKKFVAPIRLPSGMQLFVKPVSEVFKIKCGLFVPGKWDNFVDVGKLLRDQNPWAGIEQWWVYSTSQYYNSKAGKYYTLMKLFIPDDLLPLVLQNGRRLSFNGGPIYIRFLGRRGRYLKKPLGWSSAEPATSEIIVTEAVKPAPSSAEQEAVVSSSC